MVQNCSSWTELDIGSSLPVRDHEVVALEVHMLLSRISKTALGKQYDWEAMHTPEGKKKVQQIVKDIPEPSWEVDVHTHWQRLQEGLHEGLAEAFPVKQKRTRGGIFSTGTWKALARRKHAKATMQRCDEYTHDLNQQAAFRAWKDGTDFSLSSRVQILDRAATVLCLLRGLAHFRTAAKEVRELIKADKAGFVELVVDKAEAAQGVDLYKELRPLRIGGRFRKGASAHPGFAIDGEQARDHLHMRSCGYGTAPGLKQGWRHLHPDCSRERGKGLHRGDSSYTVDLQLGRCANLIDVRRCFPTCQEGKSRRSGRI